MSDSNSTHLTAAGADDGHYAIKIAVMQPGARIHTFSIPARAWGGKLTTAALTEDAGQAHDDTLYESTEGEFVTITANDMLGKFVDTRTNDYPTSSVNRALVHYALRHAGVVGPVSLVSGLPVDRFYEGALPNQALIEAKRRNLLRPIRCLAPVEVPVIEQHKVLSEAVAAYFDARYDDDGQPNREFFELSQDMPVAVVDVGGKTTDTAVVREGGTGLYKELSGTADIGSLTFCDQLDRSLRKEFALNQPINIKYLERAVQTGKYTLYGKGYDVSEIVNRELASFADQVRFETEKRLKDASAFGRTLFVGGGAEMLKSMRDRVFPNLPAEAVTVPPNPGYANARGMAKAAYLAYLASLSAKPSKA